MDCIDKDVKSTKVKATEDWKLWSAMISAYSEGTWRVKETRFHYSLLRAGLSRSNHITLFTVTWLLRGLYRSSNCECWWVGSPGFPVVTALRRNWGDLSKKKNWFNRKIILRYRRKTHGDPPKPLHNHWKKQISNLIGVESNKKHTPLYQSFFLLKASEIILFGPLEIWKLSFIVHFFLSR